MTQLGWTRRAFLARSGAAAGILALGAAGCSSDDDDDKAAGSDKKGSSSSSGVASGDGVVSDADVPETDTIYDWISTIVDKGVRRPGYEASIWVEGFLKDQFTDLGLENVRLEPVALKKWEPSDWSVEVTTSDGQTKKLDAFPVPYSTPTDGPVELQLADFGAGAAGVKDKASLYDVELLRLPADFLVGQGDGAGLDPTKRIVDPEGTLKGATHIVPFSGDIQNVMEKSIDAGATAFIGTLKNYPGNSFNYFVPYDAKVRPIPGVWVSGTDGAWLREQMATGPVTVKLSVTSSLDDFQSNNVVGELPGADDEVVMIGTHSDGPWASAVEDGSGMSLVLAQATYWSKQKKQDRPHKLVFVVHAGHMYDGAGLHKYIEDHREALANVVLEVHLEHAALDYGETDGGGVESLDMPVPKWWFVSRLPKLEAAVFDALDKEGVKRSMILAPNAFGDAPPTDGAFYHTEGVPITQHLAAPWYLFDKVDHMDKIDKDGLVPLTRATIRIVESTKGISAAAMRQA
jgi:hypothetical protein